MTMMKRKSFMKSTQALESILKCLAEISSADMTQTEITVYNIAVTALGESTRKPSKVNQYNSERILPSRRI